MTRMSNEQEKARERIENALTGLGMMRIELRLARLRLEQARQRFPATEWLLGPVSVYLDSWEVRIETVMGLLKKIWENGNARNWA